jgi:hypothetical protein
MRLSRTKAGADFNTTSRFRIGSLLLNIFTSLYILTLKFA